jgi:hypothetical protein
MELASFGEPIRIDAVTGEVLSGAGVRAVTNVYENVIAPAAANFATSSTNLATVYGDRVIATGTGTVHEFAFTVFNSATSNTMPITTMNVQINFRRDVDSSLIGGFSGNVNFGAGLSPGFFSIVTFTNLESLVTPIVLDTTALEVEQQRVSHTGGSVRMGVASMVPINIGSSPDTMLINGAEQAFASPANPGYRIAVPEPASLTLLALGGIAVLRRRR